MRRPPRQSFRLPPTRMSSRLGAGLAQDAQSYQFLEIWKCQMCRPGGWGDGYVLHGGHTVCICVTSSICGGRPPPLERPGGPCRVFASCLTGSPLREEQMWLLFIQGLA